MAEIVRMPKLSDTMTDGVVAKWHKKVGDKVKSGEVLADIETDKATMEFESFQNGALLYIGVPEGKGAPVDSILAILGKEGEDISALLAGEAKQSTESKEEVTQGKKEEAQASNDTKKQAASAPEVKIPDTVQIVRMPKLSDTMTEGVVAKWHKKVGDKVKSGELLADIQTDKATMEFESFQDGVLLHIGVEEGKGAPVDSILAILGKGGEDVSAIIAADKNKSQTAEVKPEASSAKQETAPAKKSEEKTIVTAAKSKGEAKGNERLRISPLARKIADEKGISLQALKGSGDHGRIIKRDIDKYKTSGAGLPATVSVESYTEEPVSQMRKAIARRLGESKFSAPHFYLTMEIDMDEAIKAREAINTVASAKISFNDLVIKAVAASIRQHPKVNAAWLGDKIRYNNHINIGVAVAVEEGLLVPVVRFADGKTLTQIANEVRNFAAKAKDKKLQPSDWEGNTFTVSNLGMFGIEEFTAIINSPDACILAVGAIKQTPVVKNGQIIPGNVMKVTLSCDHRVVDGAVGSAFLKTFKQNMENPILMLGAYSI
ncbi:MAG TPA: pyruvate dehydrogenase complex dihydrolipoamide acetyltransferase [Bacteroidia bacterium]|jgi:pyruvate dehydrogenase E2 component (dihydrolipoamide acetyltransferase)|nr:pyruvate dehydrogenase complex dihydrolipoamide acetyltransferase [Bacteroidia bacterium]HRG51687.1 pyruvate dehydrogenase complex dihydrolipoamide acetyltransferase [Bacteroidia bacterium]